ncbi:MAG: hypothetical protein LUH20_05680, partial [Lachnospiraceae bacterium]|nr:hypothetical protein [Lachnospiraceae bacterium]
MWKKGKLRRTAAAFLAAALLVQQCAVTGSAAETQTDAQTVETQVTEVQTQAATETQASTESQTQVTSTESQTATETQTQAESTEAQTAATESQMQATEAQSQTTETEKNDTEASTEAVKATGNGDTETSTEAGKTTETESMTESATETAPQETETETERSARQNAGEKLKRENLVKKLEKALSYLFVAKDVTVPDKVTEKMTAQVLEDLVAAESENVAESAAASNEDMPAAISDDAAADDSEALTEEDVLEALILDGKDGQAVLTELAQVSKTLADAQTTDEVTVINLYADEEGSLDETQLTALFADKVLDITDMVYVINIVADSADQELEFSGYSMKRSGKTVTYTDSLESGSVIYNFVAIEDDAYTDYQGKLKFSGNLQGTILAPAATVESEASLAGAVYAKSVTVKQDNVTLLPVVFLADEMEEEVQAAAESEDANGTAEQSEAESSAASEDAYGEEAESEPITETEAE